MSTSIKRTYHRALHDAEAFRALFAPACYARWEIAGSLRRRKPEVGDVEHVIVPAFGTIPGDGLFAEPRQVNLLWQRLDDMVKAGTLTRHVYASAAGATERWGDRYRGVDYMGFNHEIFTACEENWGSVLAIRTGPAEFSKGLVVGLQRKGYMNKGGYVRNKSQWVCSACCWRGTAPLWTPVARRKPEYIRTIAGGFEEGAACPGCRSSDYLQASIVPVPTEERFFELAGAEYLLPEQRQ